MRSAPELFEELQRLHAEAIDAEGDDLVFLQLAVAFASTTIGISAGNEGLNLLWEAMKVGGIPIGFVTAFRQSDALGFRWLPLQEFRDDEHALEKANRFLEAIAEASAWELRRQRIRA
jgi:hypothetical protein